VYVTRLSVAIDHDLSVIIEVRDGTVTYYDVVGYIDSHVKIVIVIQSVDREAGVRRAVRGEQIWEADIRDNSRRSRWATPININRYGSLPFSRTKDAIDDRRRVGVSSDHELLARYSGLTFFFGKSTGG
jgi:hypothetical protein